MKKILLPLVIFFVGSALFAQVSPKEKQALLDLYIETNGENWVYSWDINQPVDDWHGVTVTDDKVTEISLLFNNIEGTLPNSIGDLENLQVLELSFNKISGGIPATIGNLKDLEVLAFNGNELSGTIPAAIGDISTLKQLHLSSNKLSGAIPSTISFLSDLEILNVFDNNLSGALPIDLASASSLKKLIIAENDFNNTEIFADVLLFNSDNDMNASNPLIPTAKTVIAIETSDDQN